MSSSGMLGGGLLALFGVTVLLSFLNVPIHFAVWMANLAAFFGVSIYMAVQKNMVAFVIKRVFEAFGVLWVIASLTFLLLRVLPGGPFDSEKALPPEIKANIEAKYNLNAPLIQQYGDYMAGLVRGDLGQSYKYLGRNISDIISETLPNSIQLGIYALLVAYILGIPLGVYAASHHGKWIDSALMILAITGVSLPSFLVAPIFIIVFCFQLNWFEPALWDGPAYYILPMTVLGIRPVAVIARLTRASVLDVIRSDYIRTARAKGLEWRVVLFKHVLRNSLIPVLSLSGPLVAAILTGSFVIEQIFAVPGIAKHLVLSVTNRDYPLILGTTLLFSVMLVAANLITDLLMAAFDPRVKMS